MELRILAPASGDGDWNEAASRSISESKKSEMEEAAASSPPVTSNELATTNEDYCLVIEDIPKPAPSK